MKTKAITLLFFSAAILALASCSNSSDHMTFWGAAIDGPKEKFIKKMLNKQSDTKVLAQTGDGTLLGVYKYEGTNGYFLIVDSKPDVDIVNKVSLLFPSMHAWKEYETKYFELKEELTRKYGESAGSIEQFLDPDTPDRDKPSKFFLGEAQYSTLFYDEKGSVELSIKGYGQQPLYDVRITITYIDGINNESYEDVGDECWGEE